jgi:hypothetical protein
VTTAPPEEVATAVMGLGTASTGGVMSTTVIANDPDAVLPDESVAVQVTSVTPTWNVLPDGGVQLTGTGPSTSSVAVAVKVPTAPPEEVATAVMGLGRASTGGVVSEALAGTAPTNCSTNAASATGTNRNMRRSLIGPPQVSAVDLTVRVAVAATKIPDSVGALAPLLLVDRPLVPVCDR